MNRFFTIMFIIAIAVGCYTGVRYLGSVIHYNSVQPAEDTPPPIRLVGDIGFFLTGGPLVPLWNRDATTVMNVSWNIENANTESHQQKIAADVTTLDGTTKEYDLGMAAGCIGNEMNEMEDHKIMLGNVECNFAESSTTFAAYVHSNRFHIERYDESAKADSIATTTLVEI